MIASLLGSIFCDGEFFIGECAQVYGIHRERSFHMYRLYVHFCAEVVYAIRLATKIENNVLLLMVMY